MNLKVSRLAAVVAVLLLNFLPLSTAGADLNAPVLIAGNGIKGYSGDGGSPLKASFDGPHSIAIDGRGNIFIADRYNNAIRKIDARTHKISTFIGNGTSGYAGDGGLAAKAMINGPHAIAIDHANNLFILDSLNGQIRKVAYLSKIVTTVTGNFASASNSQSETSTATLNLPQGLCIGRDGYLYIAESGGNRIIKLDPAQSLLTVVAGTGASGFSGDGGPAVLAKLNGPYGIACYDKYLYVADRQNNAIRRIDLASHLISTVAGTGVNGFSGDGGLAINAKLNQPHGIAVDAKGDIFFADTGNGRIRRIDASTGLITTFYPAGSNNDPASLVTPNTYGLYISRDQSIYIGDRNTNQVYLLGKA